MFYLTCQLCYLKFILHIKRSNVLKSKIKAIQSYYQKEVGYGKVTSLMYWLTQMYMVTCQGPKALGQK